MSPAFPFLRHLSLSSAFRVTAARTRGAMRISGHESTHCWRATHSSEVTGVAQGAATAARRGIIPLAVRDSRAQQNSLTQIVSARAAIL
jgi:hypothetical protein